MAASPPGPLDREEALALVRRRLSHADVHALEATPEGAALLRMFADLAADESARLDRSATARQLLPRESDASPVATGPAQERVNLELRRSRTGFSLIVPARTVASTPTGHLLALDGVLDDPEVWQRNNTPPEEWYSEEKKLTELLDDMFRWYRTIGVF